MERVVEELLEMQQEIGEVKGRQISDAEYARNFLPFSESSWSRLKADKYGAGKDRLLIKAAQALEELPARIDAIRRAAGKDMELVRTTLARAVLASVQAARDSMDRRIVPVLAPTGFGKTALMDYYVSRGAIGVIGRQAWQASYKAFCKDICEKAGSSMAKSTSEADAEAEMIRRLQVKGSGILYLDEANTVGPAFANGIKLIHNTTAFTIVVAAVPEPWDKFVARAEEEVRQVVNRCQPIIRASRILTPDAVPFLSKCGLSHADVQRILPTVLEVSNTFGGFKTVVSIANALHDIDAPTIQDAEAAIEDARKNVVASGIPARQKSK